MYWPVYVERIFAIYIVAFIGYVILNMSVFINIDPLWTFIEKLFCRQQHGR